MGVVLGWEKAPNLLVGSMKGPMYTHSTENLAG